MPPFQVTDEFAHFQRADQITHGKLVSDPLGGAIDRNLAAIGHLYASMWFHSETKTSVALAQEAGAIRWSGSRYNANFQNTAQYGPFLYLPQALGIVLGRAAGLTIAQSLLAARLINGLVSCVVGAFAIAICQRGRALTFATLLLPMTLSQFGSASQDALIISLSLLAISVVSRATSEPRIATTTAFFLVACVVVATTMARPSQIALALMLPVLITRDDDDRTTKMLLTIGVALVIGGWMFVLAHLMPPIPSNLSFSVQFNHLLIHPLRLPEVMVNSFVANGGWLLATMIGYLGWTDTAMPSWYYKAASAGLILAFVAPGNEGFRPWPTLFASATFFGIATATCFALYLSWTSVDQATINGLQGRYILPILPLLAWLMPSYGPRLARASAFLWWPVVVFPVVSLAVLPGVLIERYYGSWVVMASSIEALLLR